MDGCYGNTHGMSIATIVSTINWYEMTTPISSYEANQWPDLANTVLYDCPARQQCVCAI